MVMINKKFGYTLAEVMITLSLIGVLATLTISTIGSGVQERARLAEFKTAYARMESVLKNITIEHGSVYACYGQTTIKDKSLYGLNVNTSTPINRTDCPELEREFVKAMGVTRACPSNNTILGTNYPNLADDCIPSDYPRRLYKGRSYIFDNGMLMLLRPNSDMSIVYALDLNGRSGPNKWGQDIFPFVVKYTETKLVNGTNTVTNVSILNPGTSFDNATNGKTTKAMLKEISGLRD